MVVNRRPCDSLYGASAAPSGKNGPNQGVERRTDPEDKVLNERAPFVPDLRVTIGDLEKFGFIDLGCQIFSGKL